LLRNNHIAILEETVGYLRAELPLTLKEVHEERANISCQVFWNNVLVFLATR